MALFSDFLICLKTGISTNDGRVPVSVYYYIVIIVGCFHSYSIS